MRTLDPRKWDFELPAWLNFFLTQTAGRALRALNLSPEEDIDTSRQALASREHRFGRDNRITVNAMEMLAQGLREAGQYDESISLLREAVAQRSQALGSEHVQTARAESELARSLGLAKQYREAVNLKKHSIEVLTRAYGPEDSRVLTATAALAGILTSLRRYVEVEKALSGILPKLERVLGPGNQWTIRSSSNLALAQATLHKFGPAIELQRQVIEMNEAKRGHDDHRTQLARYRLAAYLHWAGEDAEARSLALAVLHTKMRLGVADEVTEQAREMIAAIEDASG